MHYAGFFVSCATNETKHAYKDKFIVLPGQFTYYTTYCHIIAPAVLTARFLLQSADGKLSQI